MKRLLRSRPSPALVIACIALFLAMGGVSYGLATGSIDSREIKNNSVRSQDIRNNDIRGKDIRNGTIVGFKDIQRDSVGGSRVKESSLGPVPRADGLTHLAVVTAAGLVARARGVSSVVRTSAGRYQVIFDRDVRGCVYTATLGDVGAAAPPEGEISTSSLASNVNGVSVRTQTSAGNPAGRPFHLAVLC